MDRKFDIIKKKNLPDEVQISGFSFLKEPTDNNRDSFDFIETSNQNEIGCMLPKRKAWFAYTKGYVKVDNKENIFVEVKSRLLLIIILIGLFVGILFSCFPYNNDTPIETLPVIGNFDVSGEQITRPTVPESDVNNQQTITFAGYGKYTVTNNYPSVELKNPEGNFVDMVFSLYDAETNDLIARTDKVSAGNYVYVNVVDYYKQVGTYTILIKTDTFDSETGEQMNGMNQKMEVIIQ
jgi:hypothetical protein